MGVSYQEARALGGSMNQVAAASFDTMITTERLMKAQNSLNTYFGTSAKFSGKIAEEYASIQARTGLSEKAMGFFTKTSMKAGVETKDILKNVHKTVLQQNHQNKLSLGAKQVQEEIAKTSKAYQLNVKGSVEELVKGVFAAKALGVSMDRVEGIASSLLDFESSIQAELEAELLLGKDINLEKARQAALEGDMAGVATEVLKNKAIMHAFDTKNVVAQEAAAKALGMNREELGAMVMEQKNLESLQKAYGKGVKNISDAQTEYNKRRARGMSAEEASKGIADEALKNQLESASSAEKLEAIMAKIQGIFVSLAEPVLAIVTPIVDFMMPAVTLIADAFAGLSGILTGNVEELSTMQWILGSIAGIYLTILTYKKASALWTQAAVWSEMIINKYKKLQLISDRKSLIPLGKRLGLLIASAAAYAIRNPWTALIGLGVAAGVGALVHSQMKDGEIDPKKGPVISGTFGSVQLDPKDKAMYGADGKIKVGTNLMGEGKSSPNNSALMAKLDQLIKINTRIAQVSGNRKQDKVTLRMGYEEVGQGISKSERQIQ